MLRKPITVLKFGSSVLNSEGDIPKAIQEIYRWHRIGHHVVAVVSALGSTTNTLLARARAFGPRLSDCALAALLATGEATSAALMALALDQAGIDSTVVDEVRLGLRTCGPVLNSEPCATDVAKILRILARTPVAVVPGFVGRQKDGTISLLGRGGSDLTAVFLAHQLQADRCRLVKDVDGIYEHNPAGGGPKPRRYKTLTYAEALRVGGCIVQRKAIEYAARHQLSIEVGTLSSDVPSLIGDLPISFHDQLPSIAPLRVGLLGAGTVGLGVYRTLADNPEMFKIVRVGVRRLNRDDGIPSTLLTNDPWQVVRSNCEVVIELIGGLEPARDLILEALKSGKHVITANKLVVGRYGKQLRRVAAPAGLSLLYSAAVGGAVPMLEEIGRIARTTGIRTVQGVVNGTTNFILDRLAEGQSREQALAEAQQLGLAEQDPTTDLDGSDAAHKLALLAQSAFGKWLHPSQIEHVGIDQIDGEVVRDAARSGHAVRLVASLSCDQGGLRARVAPQLIQRWHAFARTHNEENCLEIESVGGDVVRVRGKGAGRWPTAVSVVADLFDLYHSGQFAVSNPILAAGRTA
jgi:homoserine dehydrogenase